MSSSMCRAFLIVATSITYSPPETCASRIFSLEIPRVIRNGSGPIDLSCVYNVREDENGLVIKWYHNMEQIYQWIPPMPPQDVGVISGLAEYPEENLQQPTSKSVIRLKMVTAEMNGEYVCVVSTFQEEDSRSTKMIVYVPERSALIDVSSFNESHLNLTCSACGVHPRPALRLYIEGIEVNNYFDDVIKMHKSTYCTRRCSILGNSLEPMVVECEISIPQTDYKRRERIVYYPTQTLSQTSNAARYRLDNTMNIIFLYVILLVRQTMDTRGSYFFLDTVKKY